MARIDNDEDDDLGYEDDTSDGSRPWTRRLIKLFLVCLGVGLGFLIPYMLYLNHQVTLRFDQLRWQLPTRVYARPLQLQPEEVLEARFMSIEAVLADIEQKSYCPDSLAALKRYLAARR